MMTTFTVRSLEEGREMMMTFSIRFLEERTGNDDDF
jgi:hypothetical protein